MSYGEPPEPTSRGWLIFGWGSIAWIALQALPTAAMTLFALAFCDAPGMCDNVVIYAVPIIAGGIAFWLWLLIALIRRRFSRVLRIVAILVDLAMSVPLLFFAQALL